MATNTHISVRGAHAPHGHRRRSHSRARRGRSRQDGDELERLWARRGSSFVSLAGQAFRSASTPFAGTSAIRGRSSARRPLNSESRASTGACPHRSAQSEIGSDSHAPTGSTSRPRDAFRGAPLHRPSRRLSPVRSRRLKFEYWHIHAVTQRELFGALVEGRRLGPTSRDPDHLRLTELIGDLYENASPVLARLGMPATAYVISSSGRRTARSPVSDLAAAAPTRSSRDRGSARIP